MAIVNAYILYALHMKQMKQKQRFRTELAQHLLVDAGAAQTPPNEQQHGQSGPHKCGLPTAARLTERHFMAMYDSNPAGKRQQHNCAVCSNKEGKGRKTTSYKCKQCNLPMWMVACFELYHTKVDPKRYL